MTNGITSPIKKLPTTDIPRFVSILSHAYPAIGLSSAEAQERVIRRYTEMQEEESCVNIYGYYRTGTLAGGMMLHDFPMRLLSTDVLAGGIGMVAVDLPYKKEKMAREMIRFYLNHYRDRGAMLAMLYPFRPDFYKAMGFGIGSKMHQYHVTPESLPKGPSKSDVRLLDASDVEEVLSCHNALARVTHGMTYRRMDEVTAFFTNPENRVAGVWRDGRLGGYICFTFVRVHDNNFGLNDLHVRECVYHESADFLQLMTFLRSQSDQVRRITLTTPDDDLHHFLVDPRDGSNNVLPHVYHQSNVSGVGLMYRVLDVRGVFSHLSNHDFGAANCTLKLAVTDTLCPEQAGTTGLQFRNGRVEVAGPDADCDVEVGITIADLSSLLMGTISFKSLVRYGQVEVSNSACIDVLDRLFHSTGKPVCWARF